MDSYPFCSMLIGLHVPEIQLFQILTLKIQGQGHGCSQSSKSRCESNILSTPIPLVPCQSAHPFLINSIFKIWSWKSKVRVIAHDHKVGITLYRLISLLFHVGWPSRSWDTAISRFANFMCPTAQCQAHSKAHTIPWQPWQPFSQLSFQTLKWDDTFL